MGRRKEKASSVKNILFIAVDQIRSDTLGAYGNTICKTPRLDELAAGGTIFSRAYTPCSLCTPARASIFTGNYAFNHGMGTNCDMYHSLAAELPRPEELLHRRLLENGFRCGYVGKWHVGTQMGPVDYGFEGMNIPGYGNMPQDPEFQEYLRQKGLSYSVDESVYGNENGNTLLAGRWNGPTESTPAHFLADKTIGMIEDYAAGDVPFFLTCQFWGPHMPHLPSAEFYGLHDPESIPPWRNAADDWTDKPKSVARMGSDFYRARPNSWEEWRRIVACYYDFTTMIDYEIGRILDALNSSTAGEDTLIIFSTDHGDMTGAHGGLLDKGFMYEEAHHIPLIFSGPGVTPGAEVDDLVMNMDIFPTILDMAGFETPDVDSESLAPALAGAADRKKRSSLYLEFHGLRFLYSQRALITDDGWKYIFTPGDFDELYRIDTEGAGEMVNCIEEPLYHEVRERMRDEILRQAERFNDPLQDCIGKLFGRWTNSSGQPDPTRIGERQTAEGKE